ncbi:MAG: Hsp33 family molecular chaperone HslO [Luminiphilus sp.]|jgi:molecular chaperone Hsp33|nr:Hsp33 family molecular chaperone HslO [Luminiphilus sp.]|tara:strand:- start:97 stop:960 length:864 start_codon:yes stop_codon:yes gene_type:complete
MSHPVDSSQRFLFDGVDVRGESVRISGALTDLLANQAYSATLKRLLGEFAAAAVLISNNLKYEGRIILQARSKQAVSLVMVECSSESHIRGIAQGDLSAEGDEPMDLLREGQLVLTVEREAGQRYQGIIALEGGTLAAALEDYFSQSEQLGTRFWLASDGVHSAGLMLQQLPAQLTDGEERSEQWSTLCLLTETVKAEELLGLTPEALLFKLYQEETVTVYPPAPILFKCRCSRERSADAISMLPESEREEILAEQGDITMTCELCGATYQFGREVLPPQSPGTTLH